VTGSLQVNVNVTRCPENSTPDTSSVIDTVGGVVSGGGVGVGVGVGVGGATGEIVPSFTPLPTATRQSDPSRPTGTAPVRAVPDTVHSSSKPSDCCHSTSLLRSPSKSLEASSTRHSGPARPSTAVAATVPIPPMYHATTGSLRLRQSRSLRPSPS